MAEAEMEGVIMDGVEEGHVPGQPEPVGVVAAPPNNDQVEEVAVVAEEPPEEYYVEKIVKRREVNSVPEYRVKWRGYPSSQNTWEPLEHLTNCHEMVEEFDREEAARLKRKMERDRKASEEGAGGTQVRTRTNSQVGGTTPCSSSMGEDDLDLSHSIKSEPGSAEPEADGGEPTPPVMPEVPEGQVAQGRNETDQDGDGDYRGAFIKEALGSMFRQSWNPSDVPLAVIYPILFGGTILYAVRLKPETEEETSAVREDPKKGANRRNTVIVPLEILKEAFPYIVHEFEGEPTSIRLTYVDGSGSLVELALAGVTELNTFVFVQEGYHQAESEGQGGEGHQGEGAGAE